MIEYSVHEFTPEALREPGSTFVLPSFAAAHRLEHLIGTTLQPDPEQLRRWLGRTPLDELIGDDKDLGSAIKMAVMAYPLDVFRSARDTGWHLPRSNGRRTLGFPNTAVVGFDFFAPFVINSVGHTRNTHRRIWYNPLSRRHDEYGDGMSRVIARPK